MEPRRFIVKAGPGCNWEEFGVITEDEKQGLGIQIQPHQWVGIMMWDGEQETSICLDWESGLKFLQALGYHSRQVDRILSSVSEIKQGG